MSPLSTAARRVARSLRQTLRHLRVQALPRIWLSQVDQYRRDGWNLLITEGFDLTPDSIVLDFGGFVGDWSAEILLRYGCQVHIFEPVPQFADQLVGRFAGDSRVRIHPFAVGLSDREEVFNVAGDETGVFADGLRQSVLFVAAEHLTKVLPPVADLAAINIEGGEYELIPALALAGTLGNIENLVIQFHPLPNRPEAENRREEAREYLRRTHNLGWSHDFVWEYWTKRT